MSNNNREHKLPREEDGASVHLEKSTENDEDSTVHSDKSTENDEDNLLLVDDEENDEMNHKGPLELTDHSASHNELPRHVDILSIRIIESQIKSYIENYTPNLSPMEIEPDDKFMSSITTLKKQLDHQPRESIDEESQELLNQINIIILMETVKRLKKSLDQSLEFKPETYLEFLNLYSYTEFNLNNTTEERMYQECCKVMLEIQKFILENRTEDIPKIYTPVELIDLIINNKVKKEIISIIFRTLNADNSIPKIEQYLFDFWFMASRLRIAESTDSEFARRVSTVPDMQEFIFKTQHPFDQLKIFNALKTYEGMEENLQQACLNTLTKCMTLVEIPEYTTQDVIDILKYFGDNFDPPKMTIEMREKLYAFNNWLTAFINETKNNISTEDKQFLEQMLIKFNNFKPSNSPPLPPTINQHVGNTKGHTDSAMYSSTLTASAYTHSPEGDEITPLTITPRSNSTAVPPTPPLTPYTESIYACLDKQTDKELFTMTNLGPDNCGILYGEGLTVYAPMSENFYLLKFELSLEPSKAVTSATSNPPKIVHRASLELSKIQDFKQQTFTIINMIENIVSKGERLNIRTSNLDAALIAHAYYELVLKGNLSPLTYRNTYIGFDKDNKDDKLNLSFDQMAKYESIKGKMRHTLHLNSYSAIYKEAAWFKAAQNLRKPLSNENEDEYPHSIRPSI